MSNLQVGSLKEVTSSDILLNEELSRFYNDPYGFVMYVYPWGSGELFDETGPDTWQTIFLKKVSEELVKRENSSVESALRIAVASGHGVGKTAMVAWIIHWFLSTRPKCQIVVTANTAMQLSTKTWRETNKWLRLAINRHHFVWTATKIYHTLYPEIWFASAIPWSKDNAEAFAGTHEKHVLILFDEASAIDDIIWEVVEGALTTRGSMIFCFGNPTRSLGKFHDAFHSMKERWISYQVDSRQAKKANQQQLKEWIDDYGEDSDFVKVRIKGEFPKLSANQFISADLVQESIRSRLTAREFAQHPVIIGVDVARFGNDQSVIVRRQGQFMYPPEKYHGLDNMSVAGKVIEAYRKSTNKAIVCVDGVGLGAGVVDRLTQLGVPTIDVQSAERSIDIRTYCNKRGEVWGRMKDWLIAGGRIPDDKELAEQLSSVQFGLNKKLQIVLETKADIKRRNGYSPDIADALAYTFAYDEAKFYATNAKARTIKRVDYY
jgi:hypothetical protein